MNAASLSCLLVAALAGCASAPLAPDRFTSIEASIQAADEVGAGKVPQATLHVQLAREALETAKKLAAQGDAERAELFLDRADADAELAMALARSEAARNDADVAKAAMTALEGASK